jgi:hypothetical protein
MGSKIGKVGLHTGGRIRLNKKGRAKIVDPDDEATFKCSCKVCPNCTTVALKCIPHLTPFRADNEAYNAEHGTSLPTGPICAPNLWRMCYHGDAFGTGAYESYSARIYESGIIPGSDPPEHYRHAGRRVNCHKLFVWKDVRYKDNAVLPADEGKTPDYVLSTNGAGSSYSYFTGFSGGPFASGYIPLERDEYNYPIEGTGQPTGDALDEEPYWWKACDIGGYALVSSWFNPTVAELDTHRNEVATVLADGTYTHLVLVELAKWKKRPSDGNTIQIPENKGSVYFNRWHVVQTL